MTIENILKNFHRLLSNRIYFTSINILIFISPSLAILPILKEIIVGIFFFAIAIFPLTIFSYLWLLITSMRKDASDKFWHISVLLIGLILSVISIMLLINGLDPESEVAVVNVFEIMKGLLRIGGLFTFTFVPIQVWILKRYIRHKKS